MQRLQTLLVQAITEYVKESPLNRLRDIDGTAIFDEPLVGFVDGDDPLFALYKTVVAEFHLTPRDALAAHWKAARGEDLPEPLPLGVVSWVLPIARETRKSNRQMVEGPSRRWNNTRFQGEEFNDSLRRHVVSLLEDQGYVAVAPVLTPDFQIHDISNGRASTWSERHMAYAAGHGTFSLSDGLITKRGIAHRCGSVVVNAAFTPSPRKYTHYQAYCLSSSEGGCGTCIQRCPAGAIGPEGHDKRKCHDFLFVTQADWVRKPGYIGSYGGCGLCQTGVPCEAGIPRRSGKS